MSESGAGYTWATNSRDNQLTQWSNDPVSDPPGEAIYVRDEESGELWTPTLLPIREEQWPYVAVHGQGYSRFEHTSHEIALTLLQLVPLDDPVKISRLTIENHSGRTRRLSVTAYVEWVLGFQRAGTAPFVVTEIDAETGAMLARNPWNADYAGAGGVRRPRRRAAVRGRPTGGSFSAATARSITPRRSSATPRSPVAWAPGSTRARRCKRRSQSDPARASRSCSCSARRRAARRPRHWSRPIVPPTSTPCCRR